MSSISTFQSKQRAEPGPLGGDTVTGQTGKRVASGSDLPPMKRTGLPKLAGGGDCGNVLEVPGSEGRGV